MPQDPVYKLLDLAIFPVPMELSITILQVLFVCVSVLMVLVILMQRPKSEGLGAAFGGGVTENIFGAQTTNVLTKITGWLAAIFFLLTFALSILYAKKGSSSSNLGERMKKDSPPVAILPSPTPTTTLSPTPGSGPTSTATPSGMVTNPAPASSSPAPSVKPADLAVGAVPPVSSTVAPPSSPTASPQPTATAKRRR